jgi:hypothetical protein
MSQPAVRPIQRIAALPQLHHVIDRPRHRMLTRKLLIHETTTQPALRLLSEDLSLDPPPRRARTPLAVGHGYLQGWCCTWWWVAQGGVVGGTAQGLLLHCATQGLGYQWG